MSNKTFKIFADKMGGNPATSYIGVAGDLFYDPDTGQLRVSDGVTAGGVFVSVAEYESSDIVTSHMYVDYKRVDIYTATGSREFPFKTLQAAYTAAALVGTSSNPIYIVLVSGNTSATAEVVTFSKGHIFLVGDNSSGTHAPIIFYGNLTFTGPNLSISENHFAIQGIEIIGSSGTSVLTFSGTYPQRLFMKDVWVTANGNVHGINMTNTGTGSSLHCHDAKLSHNGTGHYHCINIAAGTANIDSLETSGVGVAAIGVDGGTCNIRNSEIECGGTYAIDVYAGGVLTMATSLITTTAATSHGIILRAATAVAIVGTTSFRVPAGDAANRAISGVAGTALYYADLYFLPGYTDKISVAISSTIIDSTPNFVS
jgi:hypothetical protein